VYPIDRVMPFAVANAVICAEAYWADSTGRRNTSNLEVLMGRPAECMTALKGRSLMKSPGKPSLPREIERKFWVLIAAGQSSEEAAASVGVSPAAGTRWFRESGGMSPFERAGLSDRYLSFAEREEIALLKAQVTG
jgi:hypothetical protein